MAKIKVFKFEVSNWGSLAGEDDAKAQKAKATLSTPSEIEETINNFICGKVVQSVTVNHVDVKYHNNAGGNWIHLYYTILYTY